MDIVQQVTNISEGTIKHKCRLYIGSLLWPSASAANTQSIFLLGIPAKTLIVGMWARLVTQFTGFGLNLCTVSVGGVSQLDSTVTSDNYYMPSFSCTQVVSPTSFMYGSPVAMLTADPQDIRANFTTLGAYLNAITAGEVELTITYRSL
jgi:hypothetical protein